MAHELTPQNPLHEQMNVLPVMQICYISQAPCPCCDANICHKVCTLSFFGVPSLESPHNLLPAGNGLWSR